MSKTKKYNEYYGGAFSTGDSPPLKMGVLRESCEWLVARGFDFLKPIGDAKGTYSYLMRYQGQAFFLVARRASPLKRRGVQYISSQKFLIIHAADSGSPLLVAMWPTKEREPTFRLFNPRELKNLYASDLTKQGHENTRQGVRMLNYEWDLGVDVNPQRIWEVQEKLEAAKQERERYDQTSLKPIELRTTVPQHMIHCVKCEAYYSNLLGTCPQCGEMKR